MGLITLALTISGTALALTTSGTALSSDQQHNKDQTPIWGYVNKEAVKIDEARFWQTYQQRLNRQLQADGLELKTGRNSEQIGQYICQQREIQQQAESAGLGITAADDQQWAEQQKQQMMRYGGGMEYLRQVRRMYQSERMYRQAYNNGILAERLFEHWYGARGEKAPANLLPDYIEQKQLLHFDALSAPSTTENRQQLTAIRTRLQAEKNSSQALNKEKANWPTPLLNKYPNGRLISQNALPQQLAHSLKQIKTNELTDLIEADGRIYLALKLPISPTTQANNSTQPIQYWAARQQLFRPRIEAACEGVEVALESTKNETL